MTPAQFEQHLNDLSERYGEFYEKHSATIAAKIAVDYFKNNFQTESWEHVKWPEVKRRMGSWERDGKVVKNYASGAATTRKILTGETADLGRSIEIDKARTGAGRATVWTAPSAFTKSEKIYADVHNEGLMAGRGKGFKMKKRQFMGESEELNQLIIDELERKLNDLMNNEQ